jgi:FKBP-type peptidyl-prolyl cis-trans isomerase
VHCFFIPSLYSNNLTIRNFSLDKFSNFKDKDCLKTHSFSIKKKKISNFVSMNSFSFDDSVDFKSKQDLTGDSGVIKKIVTKGSGSEVPINSLVKVHYTGKLENGEIFDSSLDRKEPYVFKIGEGKVIKGWEIGIKTMKVGEIAELDISANYGYKKKGIPPIIPPNAKLFFEIELLEIIKEYKEEQKNLADSIQETPRTPERIAEEFEIRLSKKKNLEKKNFGNFFFISPFQSQSGEKAPWYLNPNITFISVFIILLLLFWIVLSVGGIHQGYVDQEYDINLLK